MIEHVLSWEKNQKLVNLGFSQAARYRSSSDSMDVVVTDSSSCPGFSVSYRIFLSANMKVWGSVWPLILEIHKLTLREVEVWGYINKVTQQVGMPWHPDTVVLKTPWSWVERMCRNSRLTRHGDLALQDLANQSSSLWVEAEAYVLPRIVSPAPTKNLGYQVRMGLKGSMLSLTVLEDQFKVTCLPLSLESPLPRHRSTVLDGL